VDAADARVSVFDHGITVGDGVFETLKAVDGRPFATRRHLERLRTSAAALSLRIPYDDEVLRRALDEVAGASGLASARVRLTVTGGAAPLGSERGEAPATVVVAAAPMASRPATTSVCLVPWPRNERGALAGVKSTSYAENVVALARAKEQGCTEAIFETTTGLLSEGTGSNVFVGVGGRLLTPPLSAGCLAGVTRALVLEWTDAVEADIPMATFAEADEVFLTSTGRDVQAVDRVIDVEGRPRDLAAPGPLTQVAMAAWAAHASQNDDP
jgi:branched-chain amino acid aminotransferase